MLAELTVLAKTEQRLGQRRLDWPMLDVLCEAIAAVWRVS
jgi:hypothetical protein